MRDYLLQCLQEECAEVIQSASKCVRFGEDDKHDGQTCIERLEYEFNDLLALAEMLGLRRMDSNIAYKKVKIKKWLKYSEEKGKL